ncbi:MAG: SPOR domain-containing protein [Synergistaceae bacterium]|nr:SPOR domain-containing protein [Synergistaceae bacterium]
MPLRETRRFKANKSYVMSFGDFMLPLVGLVAIGLLLVAGKVFFFTDFQGTGQPIPLSVSPPGIPGIPAPPADFETPRADAAVNPATVQRADGNMILDLSSDNSSANNADPAAVTVVVVSAPEPEPAPVVTPSVPAQRQPDPTPAAPEPKPAAPVRPAEPERPAAQPNRNWMVQVGAYSTRSSAEAVSRSLAQAGYTVNVSSGTLHRVLIQAGPTKQDALNLASRLQTGFPGAFVVPPR